jgi:arylsulfate sulfotransferase
MAKNCVGYGAFLLLAAAAVLTGCASGSSSMVNAVSPTTTASISATSYDFGQNIVGNPETQTVVEVTNTGTNPLTLNPTIVGSTAGFTVVAAQSCGTTLAAASSCPVVVTYAPTTAGPQTATLNLSLANVPLPLAPGLVTLTGSSAAMTAGTVTATNNPQVALYTITPPYAGNVTINFGPTTSYGKQTWSVATPSGGGPVSIYVAGMLASTAYHMQAAVTLADGVTATDVDHTFTTGAVPANMHLTVTATTTPGATPQSGLELLNPLEGTPSGMLVTDLSGNVLWTYADPGNQSLNYIQGVKALPDGDFLLDIGANSETVLNGPLPTGTIIEIREVDLGGNTIHDISIPTLNSELAAATCAECKVTLATFHHDVTPLPNGHWLVLANTTMALSSTTTPALTNEPPQTVLGDVIVDLDQNMQPVWVWNEFNHLDVNRHPENFPDWTHTNAIIYSKDDGNLLVSMRHQNWVIKVDYNNGAGAGDILWHLGEGGDFTLVNGTDPTDWFTGQHGPSFTTTNTTGIFGLTLMDNGDFRTFPSGVTCGSSGAPPCLYTTVPIFQINETAKTATLIFHQIVPTNLYNWFGGNAEQLANGNEEYDLCGLGGTGVEGVGSSVYEVTQGSNPQTVWNMNVTGTNLYRAFRIPSFYPGVQW